MSTIKDNAEKDNDIRELIFKFFPEHTLYFVCEQVYFCDLSLEIYKEWHQSRNGWSKYRIFTLPALREWFETKLKTHTFVKFIENDTQIPGALFVERDENYMKNLMESPFICLGMNM